jgi:predicted RNase H-like HicB family nuclease
MTDEDLRGLVAQYQLRVARDFAGAPADYAWYAFYEEVPRCVARAASKEAVLEELDRLTLFFLRVIVSDKGPLPNPIRADGRGYTITWHLGPNAGGSDPRSRTETKPDRPPVIEQGQLVAS